MYPTLSIPSSRKVLKLSFADALTTCLRCLTQQVLSTLLGSPEHLLTLSPSECPRSDNLAAETLTGKREMGSGIRTCSAGEDQ